METKTLYETREAWLQAATSSLRDGMFREQGAVIPAVRVSVGFPGGAPICPCNLEPMEAT